MRCIVSLTCRWNFAKIFNGDLMRFIEIQFSSPPDVSVQGLIDLEQLTFYLICLNKISFHFIGKRFKYRYSLYSSSRCDLHPLPLPDVCMFHIRCGKRDCLHAHYSLHQPQLDLWKVHLDSKVQSTEPKVSFIRGNFIWVQWFQHFILIMWKLFVCPLSKQTYETSVKLPVVFQQLSYSGSTDLLFHWRMKSEKN